MDVQESLRQILESREGFCDRFYVAFFHWHPEVWEYFAHVNLQRQAVLLTVALQMVVQYHLHSFPAIEAYFTVLGQEHCRRGIGPELYPKFREVMLRTLSRFHGRDWDEQLAQQWTAALELASEKILAAYTTEREG